MEPEDKEKPIDIKSLQKEVLEMRASIPKTYQAALKRDFEQFKQRLTNIVAQGSSIQYSENENPAIDMSIFESNAAQRYDEENLSQYINNAEKFVSQLKEIRGKSKI